MLLSMLIYAEAFEVNISTWAELWLNRTRDVNWTLKTHLGHTVLDNSEFDRNLASDFDGTAKADLAIALREVQVTSGELGAFDVHGKINLAPTGQILNVAIAAMLWSTWNGSCSFLTDFLFNRVVTATHVDGLWFGWKSYDTVHMLALADELSLAFVPDLEDFMRRSAA